MTVKTETRRTLRMDRVTIRSWLDRLDRGARPPTALSLRRSERFDFRPDDMIVELTQPGEAAIPYAVACRNVSREGLGFLIGKLVYPGTRCRTTLVTPYGEEEQITGRVARCRYLVGSGSLYEVGVTFDRPIDVTMFAPHAKQVHILLVDDDATTQELFAGFLQSMHANLVHVTTREDALSAIAAGGVDMVLIDLEHPSAGGFDLAWQIRSAGYVGTVVGMAVSQPGDDLRARCTAVGLTGYLAKPVTRDDLCGLVTSLNDQPLVSSLARDPALAPLINRFVASLHARVTGLTLAGETGDRPTMERIVRSLRAEAGSYGFEDITEEAVYVHELITSGASNAHLQRSLHRLLHLCMRARPVA